VSWFFKGLQITKGGICGNSGFGPTIFQKVLQHLVARRAEIVAAKSHIDFSKGLPTQVATFAATVTSLQRF
jgi:hypothetical protein